MVFNWSAVIFKLSVLCPKEATKFVIDKGKEAVTSPVLVPLKFAPDISPSAVIVVFPYNPSFTSNVEYKVALLSAPESPSSPVSSKIVPPFLNLNLCSTPA